MADFIKYLIIDSVDEEADPGKYLKREQILEVRDAEGDPWEPVPGPDPWDDLVVEVASRYSAHNDYSPGAEIFGHPATYIGGNPDNTTYRYRWQYKAAGESNWVNSSWTNYTNGTAAEVNFFIPNTAAGGDFVMNVKVLSS